MWGLREDKAGGLCTWVLWEACFLGAVFINVGGCPYFLCRMDALCVLFIYSACALYGRNLCGHYVCWGGSQAVFA